MKLQTEIPLKPQQHNLIDYNSRLILLGSCFVENIGEKLAYYKFQNTLNPFGILFHPFAIESLLLNAINDKEYTEEDVFFHNEQWHCYGAHSKLSASSKDDLLQNLNQSIQQTKQALETSSHIVITLGTAWIYRLIESDEVVVNCHKVPQKKFSKELLAIDAIAESLQAMVALAKSVNPEVSVIFTVSPVRHLKDGFVENTQSKAHLISAVHQVVEPRQQTCYFPSYEILMDELRDYRFYAEDMVHPNPTAINYVWERFKKVWFHGSTKPIMKIVDTVQKGMLHRPFNPNSEAHQGFLKVLKEKKEELVAQYPFMEF
ncbi:GSCFA domain-containing protein [Mangrovimonas sp. DI 80]|uniref:GSCFA domain-containing protein n=1 Tax=Mangrovimonas sp. DI 80 TaxID=1779330 RepID=UPI0009785ED7|nr:GSCFA domain-containing protein [Mangrovimonas sp. DI 80]OMP31031.1 GSCFA domain-containing protein [Mangrovimonas sp. DI 80]